MNSVAKPKFAVKPLVAAVALAVTAVSAYAAPTPNQMPGAGRVEAISAGGGVQVNGGGAIPVTTSITGLTNGSRIDVYGQVVLHWGVTVGPVDINPSGFNLGAGATLTFGASPLSSPTPAILNVDVSGNASQIFGNLVSTAAPWAGCPACTVAPAIFVANANGIVVGAGGRIVAPTGVGLIGANMDSALQRNDFIRNNDTTTSFVDILGGQSFVQVDGAINGDLVANVPAAYVLVAGGDFTNTGNIFANANFMTAGLRASPSSATVAGVTGVTVNRFWNVSAASFATVPLIAPAPGMEIASAGSNIVNTGSISSVGGVAYIYLGASGNVRSGTMGSTDTLVGLFADTGVFLDSYSNTGTVELYNVLSGYTTNKTMEVLGVNRYSSGLALTPVFPDVTINALTPGAQPSSITTIDEVWVHGGNVTISSTINHKGTVNTEDLLITGSKSVTISAAIGAGDDVTVVSGGPLVISGNVTSDLDGGGAGGIYIYNTGAGAPTTISGNLTVAPSGSDDIYVGTLGPLTVSGNTTANYDVYFYNLGTGAGNFTTISGNVAAGGYATVRNGPNTNAFPLTISGAVAAAGGVYVYNYGSAPGNTTLISGNLSSSGSGVYIYHYGIFNSQLTITGTLTADSDIFVGAGGDATVGPMNAGDDIDIQIFGTSLHLMGALTAGDDVDINARTATTLAYPAAVITAPTVYLDVLNFRGVNAAGLPYATLAEKPAAQIVTDELDVDITGSINAPIAGNTNWLNNSVMVAPFSPLSSVEVSVSATGGGFQAVNIGVTGNMIADSGTTTTPFIGVPLTTGGFPAGGLQGNVGSSLILHASGSVTMVGMPTGSLFGPPLAFQFPGGIAVKAGTTLTTMTPVYNAWTTVAIPFQGQWYEAPYIVIGSFLATSGNTWTNFSSAPVSGFPTTYQIREINPSSYGFALAPEAVHKNTYSAAILGGPICMTGGPTTFTVCP